MNKMLVTTTMLTALLAGCADPKAASESNFKVAIQNYLDHEYPHCFYSAEFPIEQNLLFGQPPKFLDNLAQEGLITKSEKIAPPLTKYHKPTTMVVFEISENGKQVFIQKEGDKRQSLCFGKATLKELIDFTEPNSAFGKTFSEANYTYTVTDIPTWAKLPEIQKQFSAIKKVTESENTPIKVKDALILSNKGWVHERMFGKSSDEK